MDVAYDRLLVEALARGRRVEDVRFRPEGGLASVSVPVVMVPGPLGTWIADTVSASHVPYAGAVPRADALDGAPVTLAGGEPAAVDLVRLRAVRMGDPALEMLAGAGVRRVRRDDHFALRLADASDNPFNHAPSGDARRLRALARDEGVVLVEAEGAAARRATAREITAMFAARARTQGIANAAKLAEVAETAVALAGTNRTRVFALRTGDGTLVAGTLGLVAGATFFGLVGCGVDEGSLAKRSPGRLVKIAALDQLRREGVTTYDFGLGETSEKLLVCNHRAPVFDVFVPFTLAGQVVGYGMAASLALRRRAKEAKLGDIALRWRKAPTPAPAT
jgi:CelD/BcsL family acetyltransferase involved in cellulose biosynthesis